MQTVATFHIKGTPPVPQESCLPAQVTEPSARARELVRGAYDLHVHVEPDLAKRRIDDLALARRFSELGLAGFVLKSPLRAHAERAAVVRGAVPGVDALGGIALNNRVGGLNAQAVEIAAREGAHCLAAHGRRRERGERGRPKARQAAGLASDPERARRRRRRRPAGAVDRGRARRRARRRRAPRHRARDRAPRACRDRGRRQRRVRSRSLARDRDPPRTTRRRASPFRSSESWRSEERYSSGASPGPLPGKVSWERTSTRSVPPGRSATSSRPISQLANPPVEDGLALMADRLLEAGVRRGGRAYDGGRQLEEARRCLSPSSSSARIPPTSCGAPRADRDGGSSRAPRRA